MPAVSILKNHYTKKNVGLVKEKVKEDKKENKKEVLIESDLIDQTAVAKLAAVIKQTE